MLNVKLQLKCMLVGQVHVFTYTGYNDASPLLLRFGHHDICHDARIVVVEVTNRLISQNEVERLTERTHHCHTLLLSERHSADFGIYLISNTEHLKPFKNLLTRLESDYFVLNFYILQGSKLREETEFLKEMADVLLRISTQSFTL